VAGGWKTCHVPRPTWLDHKIDVFPEELAAAGVHLDRHRAGGLITGQVRAVAALMRVTGATARSYLGDEIIDMARRMLFEVAGERPGAGLMEAPGRSAAAGPGGHHRRPGRGNAGAGGERADRSPRGRHRHLRADAVRARADHRRRRAGAGRPPGRNPGPVGVAEPCGQVRQRRGRPGRQRRQTPGRGSRDGAQPAGRGPAPGRGRTDRDRGPPADPYARQNSFGIRTATDGNPAVLGSLSPLAVPYQAPSPHRGIVMA
jgi:hypothetical protein